MHIGSEDGQMGKKAAARQAGEGSKNTIGEGKCNEHTAWKLRGT